LALFTTPDLLSQGAADTQFALVHPTGAREGYVFNIRDEDLRSEWVSAILQATGSRDQEGQGSGTDEPSNSETTTQGPQQDLTALMSYPVLSSGAVVDADGRFKFFLKFWAPKHHILYLQIHTPSRKRTKQSKTSCLCIRRRPKKN
jgi:hypothetical protein